MKKIIFGMICLFLVSGCASTHMITIESKPNLEPKNDKATLVIIRDSLMGCAIIFSNYIDRKFIGETKCKSYIVTNVEPGQHYLVITTENTAIAKIDFQPGRVYYLRQGTDLGMLGIRTSGFTHITSQEASDSMNSCDYLECDPAAKVQDMESSYYETAIKEYEAQVKANPGEGFSRVSKLNNRRPKQTSTTQYRIIYY